MSVKEKQFFQSKMGYDSIKMNVFFDIVFLENYLMLNKNLEFQVMEVVCMEGIAGCMVVDLGVSITSIVASSSEPATVNQIN